RSLAPRALRAGRGARSEADASRDSGRAHHGMGAPARSDPPGGERRGPHLGQALPPRARALHPRRRAPTPTPDLSPEAGSAMRLATIDLGTNSVRLLVADIAAEGWWAVGGARRVPGRGEGQPAPGALAPLPMARTAATVADYVQRAEALG